jgi:hypothetical protein
MPIRGSPSGANALIHTIQPGRHRPEWRGNRNRWTSSSSASNVALDHFVHVSQNNAIIG